MALVLVGLGRSLAGDCGSTASRRDLGQVDSEPYTEGVGRDAKNLRVVGVERLKSDDMDGLRDIAPGASLGKPRQRDPKVGGIEMVERELLLVVRTGRS